MGLPRRQPEFREGPEAAERFVSTLKRILSVSKEATKPTPAPKKPRKPARSRTPT
jgi:hypothetical protein